MNQNGCSRSPEYAIGGFIGNRLALGRDRKKDFNEIANPLFEILEKQRLAAESGDFPVSANQIGRESFILLLRNTPKLKRKRLERAIENYIKDKSSCGEWVEGYYQFSRPQILIQAIRKLQLYLPHK